MNKEDAKEAVKLYEEISALKGLKGCRLVKLVGVSKDPNPFDWDDDYDYEFEFSGRVLLDDLIDNSISNREYRLRTLGFEVEE